MLHTRDLLAGTLQRDGVARDARDAAPDPRHLPAVRLERARGQVPAVRDEGLVLVTLGDAEARQHPREVEVVAGLDHDDPVGRAGEQVLGDGARGRVAGDGGAHDDYVAGLLGGRGRLRRRGYGM